MADEHSFVEIDQDALDKEWVRQPKLYMRYATKLAVAEDELARAKAAVEVVKAEVERDIRSDPGKYKMVKVTESAIEARVLVSKPHQEALEEYHKAKHEVDCLKAACKALDHKKAALENLVYLHGQNYFSSPRVPKEGGEAMDQVVKKSVRKALREREDDDD